MKFLKTASAIAVLPLLAACASQWDVEGAKMLENNGTAFQKNLQSEYARLAGLERDEGDWADARLFVGKARMATEGDVAPQIVADRNIPEDKVAELSSAREDLMAAYAAGGKEQFPDAAARAQAGYDCWMQEQEENFQPEDIEACKKYFMAGLADMQGAVPFEAVMIYFDFNSAELTSDAQTMVMKAAKMAKAADAVMVHGHTDTKGSSAYNEALALSRAEAVSNALQEMGVAARSIRVSASGESITAVSTADEVEESRNRRVEITFK